MVVLPILESSIQQLQGLPLKLQELKQLIQSDDSREAAIELIASENRIPKFLAKKVLNYLIKAIDEQKLVT